MASAKITQLQLLQQNLQNLVAQKQQLESQLIELESAVAELHTTAKAYRIIGKIMLATPKEKLLQELQEKKEVLEVRLKNFSKQEEKLKQTLEGLQQQVQEELQHHQK